MCRDVPGTSPRYHRKRLEEQERGGLLYLIAWRADHVVGRVSVEWTERNTSSSIERRGLPGVFGLEVVPEHRGAGIGRALMLAVERELLARGLDSVWLDTGVSEEYAAGRWLYERLGYERFGGEYVISARVPDDVVADRPWLDIVFQMTKRLT